MLSTPAPFPQVGAPAFLKPDADACRILRRHDDNTVLIALTDKRFPREIASGNKTVPLADLFETAEAALHPVPRAASGRTRREPVATAQEGMPPAPSKAVATAPAKRKRPPTPAALQKQCDKFNARYGVGQPVAVHMDSGETRKTTTRSKAEVLSGHSAVIWLDGISGCYLLSRVTALAA